MKVETYACDICQVQKQKANHWWLGFAVNGGIVVLEWDANSTIKESLKGVEAAHLCGENHVTEWVSKNLKTN